jgi:glucosylceramidase
LTTDSAIRLNGFARQAAISRTAQDSLMAFGFERVSSYRSVCIVIFILLFFIPKNAYAQKPIAVWLTTGDKANLLKEQPPLRWEKTSIDGPSIVVDDAKSYQTMDGFGHALTGGTAELMMKMSPAARSSLLHELFGNGPNDIDTTYIRVSVGASDMNDHVYTYDDLPAGETDPELKHFSLAEDEKNVIPVLREVVAIQPKIKILASPWTAPAWMKDNDKVKGGTLKKEFYGAYALYWVLYLQGMQAHGIHIDALTIQNEPENPKNTPSMVLSAQQEADFIGRYLGPALAAAGLKTKIIGFDHNCDHPEYPETILRDPIAARYTDGSGFHLYLGQISALTTVHDAFPQKNIYFTEQMVVAWPKATDFAIAEPVARLIIGAPENWSRNVLLWNLAADPQNGPHTSDGGCPMCSGAITLDGDHVTRLLAYYTAAQASKFVPPGSVRIGSEAGADSLPHVAFRTPRKKHVLIVSNNTQADRLVKIRFHKRWAEMRLPANAAATCVW